MKTPKHIAFIMDGNGRWGLARGLSRSVGHKAGYKKIPEIIEACIDVRIPVISAFVWYNEDLTNVIEARKKRLSKKYGPPYHTLEIDTKEGQHIGWVNTTFSSRDPHYTEIGITINGRYALGPWGG